MQNSVNCATKVERVSRSSDIASVSRHLLWIQQRDPFTSVPAFREIRALLTTRAEPDAGARSIGKRTPAADYHLSSRDSISVGDSAGACGLRCTARFRYRMRPCSEPRPDKSSPVVPLEHPPDTGNPGQATWI